MTVWAREIQGSGWDGEGRERLCLCRDGEVLLAEGVVTGGADADAAGLTYRLVIDSRWHPRKVDVEIDDGPRLRLRSDGRGCWRDEGDREISALAGCLDVDIAATPFTNTLPIRRLEQGSGVAEVFKVVYISVPDLTVRAVEQRYSRLAERRFLYENLASGFSAAVEVDGDGIVLDYPGLFRRVPLIGNPP